MPDTLHSPIVLVTGAAGFIGTALCRSLENSGYHVRCALRAGSPARPDDVIVGELDGKTDWTAALRRVDYIIHLAARTHVVTDTGSANLAAYRRINVNATRRLAEQALQAGVRRLVFLSSVKVNGEETRERPFTESDAPRPEDAYGLTKKEAEDTLTALTRGTQLELVIVRSPLVYGPGVKGNFLRLMRLVARGVPLPLGGLSNRRSLVYVGNLIDAILICLRSPHAAGRMYLVSDGADMSTPQLVEALARALGVRSRLVRCPLRVLETLARLMGKSAEIVRLTRSLQVDSRRIRNELGWTPPYTAAQGLEETARWYHARVDQHARAE